MSNGHPTDILLTELNYTYKNMEEKENKNSGTEKATKSKSGNALVLFLILIALSSIGYIGYDKFQEKSIENDLEIFQEGIEYATNQIAIEIFNKAAACTSIPIDNGSLKLNLIAAECLPTPSE